MKGKIMKMKKVIIAGLIVALVVMFSAPAALSAVTLPFNPYLIVTPDPASVCVGDNVAFTAIYHYCLPIGPGGSWVAGEMNVTANPLISWASTAPSIASINSSNGIATGVSAGGPVTISAVYSGTSDTAFLTVSTCEEPEPEVGNITVIKRDPGGNLLAGAGFTVFYQASGNPALPEGFTDGSGMITFPGLLFDTYIVRETTAPAGFGLAPDQTVVLNVDSLAVTVNFVDDPVTTGGGGTPPPEEITVLGITEELPFTGQSMILYIIGAAMLALAGGLTFVLRAAKSKE